VMGFVSCIPFFNYLVSVAGMHACMYMVQSL
jgi:hypothetical protein